MTWMFPLAVAVLGISIVILLSPDKWDKAVAIGVCGGLPLLRQDNGTIWLRVSAMRAYRIEDKDKLECR